MNPEKRKVLDMLAAGKITAEQAEKLLELLSRPEAGGDDEGPRYLRVIVDDNSEDGGKVNVRVPLNLLRAGVRLAALLPQVACEPINKALKEQGVDFDVSKVKPENLEDLVKHLTELTVDVEGNKGEKVRVFCE